MSVTNFNDWKAEIRLYLEHQGDIGLTVPAMLDSLATNGWAVPTQMALRTHLERQVEAGEVVRVNPPEGGACYYRLSKQEEQRPRTMLDRFNDRSGLYIDERNQLGCSIEVVVWDKRDNSVKYFRNRNGITCDQNGQNEREWHDPEWVEGSAEAFIVHAEEWITLDETPTVTEFLQHTATWIIEPNGELVANPHL